MSKKPEPISDETNLLLTTSRLLHKHLESHNRLKTLVEDERELAAALKPFEEKEKANG